MRAVRLSEVVRCDDADGADICPKARISLEKQSAALLQDQIIGRAAAFRERYWPDYFFKQ